jgi:hypothetical protein
MAERSPYEQAALDYCAPRGIRLSEFLEVWSEGDQWAALEWQADQAQKCSGCGHRLNETMGPGTEDKWNAEVSGHCDACRALHRAASIAAGRDELDPTVGARYRMWRDEATNGRIDNPGAAVSET